MTIDILKQFEIDAPAVSCERYGAGHINETYLVVTGSGRRYILQKLSRAAFKDIPGLMSNVKAVTEFLSSQSDDPRASLHLVPATDGSCYFTDESGESWRLYDYVEDSLCLQAPESPEDFRQSAIAFGRFQKMLRAFPAETLCETIPNFHNTPDRYRIFKETVERDPLGRASSVMDEIRFALDRENDAGALQAMLESGELPLRVTHNDTKLNNVMLDASTREALCVIDLDTVMPGLAAFDFGDSIRFGAATADENEKDSRKMELDLNLYSIFRDAFVEASGGLTGAEIASLPLGAKLMTLECGVRFLTDYIDGDHYFGISGPDDNLVRARNQFRLVESMERHWNEMQ